MTPRYLYKYRLLNLFTLEVLVNNTVWYAAPRTLNDPFDAQHKIDTSLTFEEYCLIWRSMTRAAYGNPSPTFKNDPNIKIEYQKRVNDFLVESKTLEYIQDIGICSLSANKDHNLLWAHYAGGHTGIAIEYDVTEGPIPGAQLFEIKYQENYCRTRLFDLFKNNVSITELATTKSLEWAYESEWRLISQSSNIATESPWTISAIIFGYKTTPSQREIVKRICGDDVVFREAMLVPDSYKMAINDIK